jgi:hypothetical protein
MRAVFILFLLLYAGYYTSMLAAASPLSVTKQL